MKLDNFQKFIKDTMLLVIPKQMFNSAKNYSLENLLTFYEIVCNKACLRKDSKDVKKVFNHLTGVKI